MARLLIFGSGVVGQATGKGFAAKGHAVTYVDVNPQLIARLRAAGLKVVSAPEVDWSDVDIVMLAVSTPTVSGKIVLDYIKAAAADVGRGLTRTDNFIVVVVRSTVLPGTTEHQITPILERISGKHVGVDFGVAMNPEFLRQVSSEKDFARPWLTMIGASDARTAGILDTLFRPFGALIVHATPTEAEMTKYVHNIYNAVKISFFNEMHPICEVLGVDSSLVGATVARSAEGLWNPLYGIRGGVPYGGACLPKDTEAFLAFAREQGWEHRMLEATVEVNRRLAATIPPADSPDTIDEVLATLRAPKDASHGDEERPGILLIPRRVPSEVR